MMSGTRPLAVQLYSVRELLKVDFAGTMQKIAGMGYVGVETAGFPEGVSPQEARQLFDDLGLAVVAAHSPLPLGEQRNQVLDAMAVWGCSYLVCPWLDPDRHFSSADAIRRACDLLNEANAVARGAGLTLLYHNHWFEAHLVDGRPAYQIMLDRLDPTIGFEIDAYWLKTGGLDPVSVLHELGPRAPLLHVKDGPAVMQAAMLAVGDGVMDYPAIIQAAAAEWLIVELDRCDSDMLTAIEKSYHYLTREGLGHGR